MGNTKKCEFCGAEIINPRNNGQKYCSVNCRRKANQNTEYISRRASRRSKYSDDILVVYQCQCAICGWMATEKVIKIRGKYQLAKGNEIHHIVPVRDGGTDDWDNLVLLCPNHHKQADLGIILPEKLKKFVLPQEYTEEMRKSVVTSEDISFLRSATIGMNEDEIEELLKRI